ncbi:hypothetical protein [Pedobacter agri]|uniref:hypothetical protein n=1 Tax=Pedobacter agri TaxID=454586 RepID=UPI00292F4907|nr:hypothetical protein [Pedobacter agri]
MKKKKSRSKSESTSKKLRKELESKLALAFNEVVSQYGKAKKADSVIEKFAKQLSKKIKIATSNDSIAPFIKDEEIELLPETLEQAVSKKVTGKKTKADKKETA